MADINKIVDELSKLTVLEVSELVKELEDKWGVSAAAPVAAVAAAAGGGDAGAGAAEKTDFNVHMKSFGGNKIAVIKEVRAITGLALGDAKKLVESAPADIKESIPKEEAEEIKGKLEAAGAEVELK